MIGWLIARMRRWLEWHPSGPVSKLNQADQVHEQAQLRLRRQRQVHERQANVLASQIEKLLHGRDED